MIASMDETVQQHLTRVNEANLSEFSLQLGMYGEVYDGTDVKWAYTDGPALNRVLDARFNVEEAEDRIKELLNDFTLQGTKPAWITGPSTTPSYMDELLSDRGYHRIPWSGMAADLRNIPESIPYPEGLRVQEITDLTLIKPWSDVLCRGFGWDESIHEPVCDLFSRLGVCNAIPWRHYIGFYNDHPVSTTTVFDGSGALGVYLVAVAPEARRQGFGIATTWHALNEARNEGHRLAVLQASPMGKGVYEKIGFTEHCEMSFNIPWKPRTVSG